MLLPWCRQLRRRIGFSMLTWFNKPKFDPNDSSGKNPEFAVLALKQLRSAPPGPLNEFDVTFGEYDLLSGSMLAITFLW